MPLRSKEEEEEDQKKDENEGEEEEEEGKPIEQEDILERERGGGNIFQV